MIYNNPISTSFETNVESILLDPEFTATRKYAYKFHLVFLKCYIHGHPSKFCCLIRCFANFARFLFVLKLYKYNTNNLLYDLKLNQRRFVHFGISDG